MDLHGGLQIKEVGEGDLGRVKRSCVCAVLGGPSATRVKHDSGEGSAS